MSCDVVTDLAVVVLDGVSKVYDRGGRGARWRDALPIAPGRMRRGHAALDDVSLRVEPGEALGIIGPNGAGKSTVLKLVAGVTRPTSGILRVEGTIGSMIELGVGFHPDLTGRENARTALVLHGASPSSALDALDEIEEFAGLGDTIGEPLKHYSMGMRARLAFAVATHFPADVLVVDEVLAVGDRDFQLRCLARIHDRLASGAALLFVSHEMTVVGHVCTRVVHLREGRVVDDGPAATVVERYLTQSQRESSPEGQQCGHGIPANHQPLLAAARQSVACKQRSIDWVSVVDAHRDYKSNSGARTSANLFAMDSCDSNALRTAYRSAAVRNP